MTLEELFRTRPFRIRNADEYDISNILSLFVSPVDGLTTPFDFENAIVKGRMGSGKTMYLRANHAYYLSGLVPALIERCSELILPVFIRLSDFQHLSEPKAIYRAIVVKIVEELTSIYLHLGDMKSLVELQSGLRQIPDSVVRAHKLSVSMKQLALLGSEEYIQRVSTEFGLNGGIKPKFLELSAEWRKTNLTELRQKPNPGIKDIEECYKNLLEDQDGRILLLIDEAGSLDKRFFRDTDQGSAFFEILMNQFRTASFIRTKIAVYPNSYSDMLTETRYGDAVILEDTVEHEIGYSRFRERTISLINNYLNPHPYRDTSFSASDVFEVSSTSHYGDALEQIMYASGGNMRRLIQLLDLTMDTAYGQTKRPERVSLDHAFAALKRHGANTELPLSSQEIDFLDTLVSVCRSRGAFKFQFPNVPLYKYTGRSQEYNLVKVDEIGTGRRPTTYSFDYAYCVFKDIPTHRMIDSEKICRERTNESGRWLTRVALISQELIDHAALPGKLEGTIDYVKGESGFVASDAGDQFYFTATDVIGADKSKAVMVGKRVRFYPTNLGDVQMAVMLEIL